eukprot:GILI01011153.1.p1 GENE.GILI01011153.1~~GILI01011153.1.p1  ORF type:complete len:158 (-),score=15.48 GILI01011153.1:419-892(-)
MINDLEGTWEGTGSGSYPPRVQPFQYVEQCTFTRTANPNMLAYSQKTWNSDKSRPMHSETGYIKFFPADDQRSTGRVEFYVSHPFGLVEIEVGEFSEGKIESTSQTIARGPSARPPFATSLKRVFNFDSQSLSYDLFMATDSQDLQHHLHADLAKTS